MDGIVARMRWTLHTMLPNVRKEWKGMRVPNFQFGRHDASNLRVLGCALVDGLFPPRYLGRSGNQIADARTILLVNEHRHQMGWFELRLSRKPL